VGGIIKVLDLPILLVLFPVIRIVDADTEFKVFEVMDDALLVYFSLF
jgi:hypothetical protein